MAIEWIAVILASRFVFDSTVRLFDVSRKEKNSKRQIIEAENQREYQRKLQQENQIRQSELIGENYKNTLKLQENSEILRNYPLKLHRSQILKTYENCDPFSPVPVSVFVAPPTLKNDQGRGFDSKNFPSIELKLIETIKSSLHEYFADGLIDLKSGNWKSKEHYGEAAIAYLYDMFPKLPVLILESVVENNNLYLYAGFWTAHRTNYAYERIAEIPIVEYLTRYAKDDAEEWGRIREKTLNHNKELTPEEQIREKNWKLLVGEHRNYNYSFSQEHWSRFTHELAIYHVLLVAWATDAYQLETFQQTPKLPQVLTRLIGNSGLSVDLLSQIIKSYSLVYNELENDFSYWVPGLHLDFGESLIDLPDRSLALDQEKQAIKSWLSARGISIPQDDRLLLDVMLSNMNAEKQDERRDLRRFRNYLLKTNHDSVYIKQINEILELKDPYNTKQGGSLVMKSLSSELKSQLEEYHSVVTVLQNELSTQELNEVEDTIKRLEEMKVSITAFGEVNAGKSSLLNSLLGYDNNDPDRPFISSPVQGTWHEYDEVKNGVVWREIQDLELVMYDAPGIAGDNPEHLSKAKKLAAVSDVILYVIWQPVKGDEQKTAMKELLGTGKPLIIVINKIDIQRPDEISALKEDLLKKMPEIHEEMIVMAAGDPINGEAKIEDLIDKISTVIEQQNYALIQRTVEGKIFNAARIAADVLKKRFEKQQQEEQMKIDREDGRLIDLEDKAKDVIQNYAKTAAGAAALIPFGLDALTSTLVTSGMFVHILRVFGKNTDFDTVLKVGKDLVEAFFGVLAVSGLTLVGYEAISKGAKTNPLTYLLGMTLDGVFTYFIVYTIGEAFIFYCRNDLSWGVRRDAKTAMRTYVKKNIKEMFLDKLPKKIKNAINLDVDQI